MSLRMALAGNPNSGKTTMYNELTGSTQTVGNYPGVTVEKKVGKYKKNKQIEIVDLPGIYSLSPYTLEEVVSRDYLLKEQTDVIINIVDASNLERNLYLTTQLLEMGIPVVVALNMIDVVQKRGDKINISKLSKALNCPVVETSALKNRGLEQLMKEAEVLANSKKPATPILFNGEIEEALKAISGLVSNSINEEQKRYYAIKLFERDEKTEGGNEKVDAIVTKVEDSMDDTSDSIITNERYNEISDIVSKCVTKTSKGLTFSDKIDKIITNRFLGIPIFMVVMYFVYYISVTTVGSWVTDFTNDTFVGAWVQAPANAFFESIGTAPWLTGLIVDGIIGGVGAVVGFLPQMLILFFFLALLEDCGYMARIAFLMDRIFRRFGMSGKSFIPMLIGSGCGIPGIMASRTIEQPKDRRMTIMTVTFMPCGAKLPVIALIAGALFGNMPWVAPSAYFLGIGAVAITGIMLRKTKAFAGDPAPFVIELPEYHIPAFKNVLHSMYDKGRSFVMKAVTVYMLAAIAVWFGSSFGFTENGFGLIENLNNSVLHTLGTSVAWIFEPLGFGKWQAVVASVLGLAAKEEIVGVFGVLSAIGDADLAVQLVEGAGDLSPIAALFPSALAGYSFLVFNLLCAPCFAAINTIRAEMKNAKWTTFAIAYQCIFAYVVALIIYQFGSVLMGGAFTVATGAAMILFIFMLYMLFRKNPYSGKTNRATEGSSVAG